MRDLFFNIYPSHCRFSPDPSPTMRQSSAKLDNEQQTNPTAAKVAVNSRSSTGQKMTSPPAKKPPVVKTSLPSPVPPINNATNDIKQVQYSLEVLNSIIKVKCGLELCGNFRYCPSFLLFSLIFLNLECAISANTVCS